MECANALAREVDDLSRRKPCWRVWAFDSTRSLLLRSCKPLSPFLPLPLSLSPLRFVFSLKEAGFRGHAKNLLSSAGDVPLRRPRTLHRPTRSVRERSLWNPSLPALLPITSRALSRHLSKDIISALAHTLVAHGTPLFPPLPPTQISLLPLEYEDLLHRIHHRHGIGHLQDCCGPRTFKHTRACIHMHFGA